MAFNLFVTDDIYYNIIKRSKPKDIISLYFVNQSYQRVLNKPFVLKELSNQYHIKIDTFKNFVDFINIKISCGYDYTILIKNNQIYVWGNNKFGQLGLGHNDVVNVPTKLNFDFKINKIVCGIYYTIAITDDGLYVWGYNRFGQLGLGHNNNINIPTKLNFKINKIVCSSNHTIAITEDGLYVWG